MRPPSSDADALPETSKSQLLDVTATLAEHDRTGDFPAKPVDDAVDYGRYLIPLVQQRPAHRALASA